MKRDGEGQQAAGLVALCVASGALSLVRQPGWLFGKYPNLAAALGRGALTGAQVADASPGYLSLFLVLSPGQVRLLQAVVGSIAVALVFGLADRATGRLSAWVAAALLAFAGPWMLYGAILEPDLLVAALDTAAVLVLARADGRGGARGGAIAGAILGGSIALRPSGVLLAAAAAGWVVLTRRREVPASRRVGAALALLGTAVVVAGGPVLLLRRRAESQVLATMSFGQVLHQGHRPEGSGLGANYPTLIALAALQGAARSAQAPDPHHEIYRGLAAVAAGRDLGATGSERYWAGQVGAFAAHEPGAFLRQLARKLAFAVAAPAGDADIPAVQEATQRARWPGILGRVLSLLGAGGLLLTLGVGGALRLVHLWVGAYLASFVIFYYQSRYGLAILPAWAVLAGAAVAEAGAALRDRRRIPRTAAALLAPLLALAPHSVRDEERLLERTARIPVRSEAVELRAAGRFAEARDRLVDEQAAVPDYTWPWSPHGYALGVDDPSLAQRAAQRALERYGDEAPADAYLLAVLHAASGRCDLALPLARRAASGGFHGAVADTSLDPDLLAADCHLGLGNREAAYASVRASLARWPGTLDGLARAVAIGEAQAGDTGPEVATHAAELEALHDPASARYALARARRRAGAPLSALADARWLGAHVPEVAPLAAFEEALDLVELGRGEEALAPYARALSIPFAMHGAGAMDATVRAALRDHPDDPATARLALAHWSARGQLDEVRALLARHPELAVPVPATPAPAPARPPAGG